MKALNTIAASMNKALNRTIKLDAEQPVTSVGRDEPSPMSHIPPDTHQPPPPTSDETEADAFIQRLLRAVRQHLDLDVAFIGQFVDNQRVFRYVDCKTDLNVLTEGDASPVEESYCHYVVNGDLPEFLPDPAQHVVSAAIPATQELPVGTHLSVPIRFSNGRLYGTFCCFALDVRQTLGPEHLHTMRLVAELAADYLETIDNAHATEKRRRRRVQAILNDPDGMTLIYQPLYDLNTMTVMALEALTRLPGLEQGPQWFFAEAEHVGLGFTAEMRAVTAALEALPRIPAPIRLNINVSPNTLYTPAFMDAVAGVPGDRLAVEVTEHAAIEDYAQMKQASARLTELGVCLAIDDVGMGFSGLNRILQSSPKELKLDASVIRDVDRNPVKQALVEAFCSFGERAGFGIVAEGIETAAELDALRALGVTIGQGYYLGEPDRLDRIIGR